MRKYSTTWRGSNQEKGRHATQKKSDPAQDRPKALPDREEGDPRMPAFWAVILENGQCRAEQGAGECKEEKFQEKEKVDPVSDAFENTERKLTLLVERLEMN